MQNFKLQQSFFEYDNDVNDWCSNFTANMLCALSIVAILLNVCLKVHHCVPQPRCTVDVSVAC